MHGFDVLFLIAACAAARVEGRSWSLPTVDLGYAVQQATLNVSICLPLFPLSAFENPSVALFSHLTHILLPSIHHVVLQRRKQIPDCGCRTQVFHTTISAISGTPLLRW